MLNLNPKPQSEAKEYAFGMKKFAGLNMRDDQSVMSIDESPDAKNVRTEGGRLMRIKGFGVVKWTRDGEQVLLKQLPSAVVKLFEFQSASSGEEGYGNFYASAKNGKLYRFVYDETVNKIGTQAVETESGETGIFTYFTQYKHGKNNCALLGGPECGLFVYVEGGTLKAAECDNQPHMKRTVMHYGRMFGVGDGEYPQRIWFSEAGTPDNFDISEDEGGYIDISDIIGNTLDAVSYFDTLYVFCRYGIVSLDSLGAQSDFSIENIYYSDSEIIEGSVSVCGNGILFATRYGVYKLSGNTVSCISERISSFFGRGEVVCKEEQSIFFNGMYFLSYTKTDNTKGMLIYNTYDGSWQIFVGCNIRSMAVLRSANEEKLLMAQGDSGVVPEWSAGDELSTSGSIYASWKSPKNDWGISGSRKHIREVHFIASGTGMLKITVFADNKSQTKSVNLTSTDTLYRMPFDIGGDIIGFEISNGSGNNFSVGPLTFIYTVVRERARI